MPQPLVIVIEDDESMRAAVVSLVNSFGYAVADFSSGDEFLLSKVVDKADCIISDIQMPGLDGFGLMTALVKRGISIPIILITARLEKNLERRALNSGAFCLLQKPFDAEMLIAKLSQALAN
jgi:FixJ family two-component response regulator